MFELLQGTHQKQSFQIAQSIQKELTTRAKRNNRDVRQAPILVLKEASMPSVLVEVGFLSNINEERFLNSQDGRKTISDAIYHGFVNYKKNYEKKSQTNVIARTDDKKVEVKPTTNNQPAKSEPVAKASMVNNSLVYKIQILSDTKLHKKGSAALKGLWPVEYYKEGNVYKYTYGESKNRAEMNTKLTTVKKRFNDAFVIKFENGKRVK